MSFRKVLMCDNCEKYFSISEVDFPEDLYDLIIKYKIDQLSWICKECQSKKNEGMTEAKGDKFISDVNSACEIIKETESNQNLDLSETTNYSNVPKYFFDSTELSDDCRLDEFEYSYQKSRLSLNSPEYKGAHKILENILAKSKPDETLTKQCKKVVKEFLDKGIEELKKDPEFNSLYDQPYFTGSFYNKMRIGTADEYDINIVLKVPPPVSLKLEFPEDKYMFAKIKLENTGQDKSILKFLEKNSTKCGNDMYLDQKKINSWFQSLMDKYIKDNLKVNVSQSGPAKTIKISTDFSIPIDIDLVPVFYVDHSNFESIPYVWKILEKFPVEKTKEKCFLVPKPLKHSTETCLWKLDFPEVEREVLGRKSCVKPVIRLIKILRDNLNWKAISSYFIKTVVLFEVDKHPDAEYWEIHNLYERFIETLDQLRLYLVKRKIPFFFSPNCNLIPELNEDHCKNWSNKLEGIIKEIKGDYNKLEKYLDVNSNRISI